VSGGGGGGGDGACVGGWGGLIGLASVRNPPPHTCPVGICDSEVLWIWAVQVFDKVAIKFSKALYDCLLRGETVEQVRWASPDAAY
jgi:hypothetical protein